MGMGKTAPKLAKAYRNLRVEMLAATQEWAGDVVSGTFPGPEQTFH
jgi:3-methyl-2-oxobutanoate hydroxymethyltransferase